MDQKPDLVIFRIPSDEIGTKLFVELDLSPSGQLAKEGKPFIVKDGDTYNELNENQIVLAERINGGSKMLCSFSLFINETETPIHIHTVEYSELQIVVDEFLEIWRDTTPEEAFPKVH
jgi:hypothetical protein